MRKLKNIVLPMLLAAFVVISSAVPVMAGTSSENPPLVVDEAGLMTEDEIAALASELQVIQDSFNMDAVVVTVDSLDGKTPMEYADDYYDYNGYCEDGLLLLVCMSTRDWWISTSGYGITAFTDVGIEYVGECILPDLSEGAYYDAFSTYASTSARLIQDALDGNVYGNVELGLEEQIVVSLFLALVIGFVIAFIVTLVWKSQLKSVAFQHDADGYIVPGSVKMKGQSDVFLYSNTKKVKIETDNNGSSVHRSSSGSSHGGGGGKF
ncbi:MAG: TPM domain-containing protein [Eubacterium sp.]|nr:TPM domain-containing protein [Eubacterium sp.]